MFAFWRTVYRFFEKHMIGQYVKDCAPEAHAKKQGTPTTGGIFIILAVLLGSIITLAMAQRLSTEAFIYSFKPFYFIRLQDFKMII